LANLELGPITDYDKDMLKLTLTNNPYIPDKIKTGVLGYPQQLRSLIYLNRPIINDYHRILIGGEAFGGKTLFGGVISLRFIHLKGFKGLNTRKNYDDLTEESVDSIWGYIGLWNEELTDEYGNERKLKIKLNPPRIKSREGGLGNPQFDPKTFVLNDSSQRFLNEYVEGEYVYVPMGWRTNPYINQKEFEASLEDLDEIDKQSQKEGNWHYVYTQGSLIDINLLKKYLAPKFTNNTLSILSIDLAGRGRDKFVVSTLTLDLMTNRIMIDNISQTVGTSTEFLIEAHVLEDHKRGVYPSICVLEMEPGSWIDTEKYWTEFFSTMNIIVQPKRPVGSKFNRARPLIREMSQGHVLINELLDKKIYSESTYEKSYFELFKDEIGRLSPLMKISPNIIDSISQGRNFLRDELQAGSSNGMTTARA